MQVDIDPQHVIGNLKQQIAQKSEESAVNAAAATSAAQRAEDLEKQLEDAKNEIDNLRGVGVDGRVKTPESMQPTT